MFTGSNKLKKCHGVALPFLLQSTDDDAFSSQVLSTLVGYHILEIIITVMVTIMITKTTITTTIVIVII